MDRSKDRLEQAERDPDFGKTAASTGHHERAARIAQRGAEEAGKARVQRSRSGYPIFTASIPTDTLVCTERECEQLLADPTSLVAQEFPFMTEL